MTIEMRQGPPQQPQRGPDDILTVEEAADLLNLKPSTVRSYASPSSAGSVTHIRPIKRNGMTHFRYADVMLYLHRNDPVTPLREPAPIDPWAQRDFEPMILPEPIDTYQELEQGRRTQHALTDAVYDMLRRMGHTSGSILSSKEIPARQIRVFTVWVAGEQGESCLRVTQEAGIMRAECDGLVAQLEQELAEKQQQLEAMSYRLAHYRNNQTSKKLTCWTEPVEVIISPMGDRVWVWNEYFEVGGMGADEERAIASFKRNLHGLCWHLEFNRSTLEPRLSVHLDQLSDLFAKEEKADSELIPA